MPKLHFYYAAMNAGKSTTLLQADFNYRERGQRTILFTTNLDDRYGVGKISSRLGVQAKAFAFNRKYDMYEHVAREQPKGKKISCIFVDEAQFLTKEQVLQLTMIVDQLAIPVVCYGLRTDFRGEPFEGSTYLLAWAEELTEIKAVCGCGRKATMNARIGVDGKRVTAGEQICIGHHYKSMARKCFQLTKVSPIEYDGSSDSPLKVKCRKSSSSSRTLCMDQMESCVRALSVGPDGAGSLVPGAKSDGEEKTASPARVRAGA